MGRGELAIGIGDELMVTGLARQAQEKEDLPVLVLDRNGQPRWHPVWNLTPRIVQRVRENKAHHTLVNGPGVRPYIAAKTSTRWTWKDWGGPPRGEIYLSEREETFGRLNSGRIVLEPHTKDKASPNKQWGWLRWNKLAWLLQEKYGQRVTQIGSSGAQLLEGADFVATPDFRMAVAVLKNARAAVLPEGGLHHAAAAVGLPSVVIFGGYIAPAVTGYAGQVNLFEGGGLGCGMRARCDHCAEAMAKIQPDEVAEKLMEVMRATVARPLAA